MNQPEALRLARILETEAAPSIAVDLEAAAELRRLHDLNAELLDALKHAAHCVQDNYLPDMMGHDWDETIAKAEDQA